MEESCESLKAKVLSLENEIEMMKSSYAKSTELLFSIMDGFRNNIIVAERDTGAIIYMNETAQRIFYYGEGDREGCTIPCPIINDLVIELRENDTMIQQTRKCCNDHNILSIRSYPLEWDGVPVYVHIFTDITEIEEKENKLSNMAYRDTLTGIFNQRYGMMRLSEMIENKEAFCIAFIDIDGLKYVNDYFGHAFGDQYLKHMISSIDLEKKHEDVFCRIGGDELLLLSKQSTMLQLEKWLEELRTRLCEEPCDYPQSFSFGVVEVNPEDGEIIPKEILEAADSKMYQYKKAHKKERTI